MLKLLIDTRDSSKISVKIDNDGEIFEEVSLSEGRKPESVLNLVDRVLKKAEVDVDKIDEIYAEEGPGSYTGLKVGVSVANALSFGLEKKVNGQELGQILEPKYE